MQLDVLQKLFTRVFGHPAEFVHPITETLSARRKVRLKSSSHSAIGVYSPNHQETAAFVGFTKHFKSVGVNTPQILCQDGAFYLEEDLGDSTLAMKIAADLKAHGQMTTATTDYCRLALKDLVTIQFAGAKGFPWELCYPRATFDAETLSWDLNYFKYHFLMLANVEFDEAALSRDFQKLMESLPSQQKNLIHRDFQGRNIMIGPNKQLFYLDFQGARRGPAEYDVSSLLFQRGSPLDDGLRIKLAEEYFKNAAPHLDYSYEEFLKRLQLNRLLRSIQTLGTRGRRGLFQGKTAIIQSIPTAILEFERALTEVNSDIQMPELQATIPVLKQRFPIIAAAPADKLQIRISSFSYRGSFPRDLSLHGGGYVFDCRALPNPHNDLTLRDYNGTQPAIANALSSNPDVIKFIDGVKQLVGPTVSNYLAKGFTELSVDFGCTGGKHRSVFMAETLTEWLQKTFGKDKLAVSVKHRELGINKDE